jgi:hypothetical protein
MELVMIENEYPAVDQKLLEDRMPSELLDPLEKEDISQVLGDWLGINDMHDQNEGDFDEPGGYGEFIRFYLRVARIYYVFTGCDYLCNHSYLTNFEGRAV